MTEKPLSQARLDEIALFAMDVPHTKVGNKFRLALADCLAEIYRLKLDINDYRKLLTNCRQKVRRQKGE